MATTNEKSSTNSIDFKAFRAVVLADFQLAWESREASLMGRKEVLTGKAKFGIFGDGKEIAQIALAKQFKNGDFRSGYYRDQTLMMAIGQLTLEQYLCQHRCSNRTAISGATNGRTFCYKKFRCSRKLERFNGAKK